MATFPTLSKDFSIKSAGNTEAMVYTNRYAGGFEVSRALNNRVLDSLSLEIVGASKTDLTTLYTFYKTTVKGSSTIFTITNPLTNTTINARFVEGSLSVKPINNFKFYISFQVKEA